MDYSLVVTVVSSAAEGLKYNSKLPVTVVVRLVTSSVVCARRTLWTNKQPTDRLNPTTQ